MTTAVPEPQLAREFDLDINTGTGSSPVWTPIGGITGITPGGSATMTDDTDFDNDGWAAATVSMRSKSLSVAFNFKETDDGDLNPGYEAVVALSEATGKSAKGLFRYLSPNGNGHTFRASVDMQWPGGDKTGNATAQADLTVDGKPVPIVAP